MVCNNCGYQVPDGQYTCPVCGSYVGSSQPQMQYGQQPQMQYGQQPQMQYGQQNMYNQQNMYSQQNNTYQNLMNQANYQQNSYQPQLGMKWYKFVIYFLLFLSAILNLFGGIAIMTGAHYTDSTGENYADWIYDVFSGLKAIDIIMGVICIALAIYALFVRAMLAEYKQIGPKLFIAMYAIDIVTMLIYAILVACVTSLSIGDVMTIIDIKDVVINIFWIVINKIYFDNRKHLFVN
ncbi:MAG: zinc ribbon domain-containing protein [Lachnospiraceae bacterium]|nr:zinc ribbon domain-containing protein [Lachnospiraceae bacterium]